MSATDSVRGLSTAAATGRAHPSRRLRRIVVGSLLTGLIAAGVLTLGVFGGAPEHAITGSALLGFALGWAMLAVLSIRMTDQPQRWALVPAAAMAVTGAGLLVVAPGDSGLTAAGWVWPPLLLALAVWMGLQVRRSLPARSGRWALYPVVTVMVAAALGGMVETVAVAADSRTDAMPGQSYDVGGYRLHLDCTGSGSPTVVLQSGQGEASPHWSRIAQAVSGTTRVCAYDRAGQGWSDAPQAQDGLRAAADLHTLLSRAGEQGPYVLVGHSIGGAHAMTYASAYPEEVAGMVLLDSTDPYGAPPVDRSGEAGASASFAALPVLARLGLGWVASSLAPSALPEPAAGQVDALAATPRHWRNYGDDFATMPALLGQAQALTTLGSVPLVVLTADASLDRPAAHDRMAEMSSNSSHRFTDETHAGVLEEPRGADVSVRAIEDVVRSARSGSPLPQR
ncbi:alpha/beta fold hydrolase [Georgenia sp. AZ-5]|uniref:alpha/beta fold hydrolase n=1 Tax=Georgenia sp. AZ-5 TaxID=3367526 RepID=UPI0037543930